MDRRSLLKYAATLPAVSAAPRLSQAQMQPQSANEQPAEKADYTLRIANGLVELAPDHIASTTLYNGQFPGPLIRLTEGKRVVVDVHNDTDTPELVHWHGQMIPSDVDGAAEEGTPYVPPHGMRRISFLPKPSGFRFYHTHVVAGGDLNRGTYTGQAGPSHRAPTAIRAPTMRRFCAQGIFAVVQSRRRLDIFSRAAAIGQAGRRQARPGLRTSASCCINRAPKHLAIGGELFHQTAGPTEAKTIPSSTSARLTVSTTTTTCCYPPGPASKMRPRLIFTRGMSAIRSPTEPAPAHDRCATQSATFTGPAQSPAMPPQRG